MGFIARASWLVLTWLAAVALASSAAGQELVVQAREALGLKRNDTTWQLSGKTTKNGLPAFFRWTFAPEGFFLQEVRGPFPERVSFDGEKVWKVEGRAPSYSLEFLERERALTCAWLISGGWCHPNSPFEIVMFQVSTSPPNLLLRLRAGHLSGTLEVAPTTNLPIRFQFEFGFGGGSLEFLEWQEVDGRQVPKRLSMKAAGQDPQIFEVESALPWKRELPSYGKPKVSGTDTDFDATQSAEVKVHRTSAGHLFVRPLIDGRDVGWFLLDVEIGTSILTRAAIEELKLGGFGETTSDLLGVAPVPTVFRQGHVLQLGPLRIDAPVFVEQERLELFDSWLDDEKCAGALGWDVFLRAVVEMDPAEGSVRVFDPKVFTTTTPWHELKLFARRPHLKARFASDYKAWLRIDTRNEALTAELRLSQATGLGLLEESEEPSRDSKTKGRSLFDRFRESRTLRWMETAGIRKEPVTVSLDNYAISATPPYVLGRVGRAFLGTAPMLFDYQNSRVAIEARK